MTMQTSDIAGIRQAFPALRSIPLCTLYIVTLYIFLVDLKAADGTSEHVTGVGKRKQHVVKQAEAAIVTVGHKMFHRPIDIVLGVERLHFVFLTLLLMRVLLVNLLVIRAHILLLNKRRIGKHERAQVARRRGTIDIAFETHLYNIRNQSRVVNMCMAEYDAVQFGRVETQVAVRRIGLHSFSLIHTAIQQNRVSRISRDQVLTSRHLARSA